MRGQELTIIQLAMVFWVFLVVGVLGVFYGTIAYFILKTVTRSTRRQLRLARGLLLSFWTQKY